MPRKLGETAPDAVAWFSPMRQIGKRTSDLITNKALFTGGIVLALNETGFQDIEKKNVAFLYLDWEIIVVLVNYFIS